VPASRPLHHGARDEDAQDDVYKGCFVCVDRGLRETAIVLPKEDVEAGLPPAP